MSNTSNTKDGFSSILNPELCSNTDAFLTLFRSGVYDAASPLAALDRFPLRSVTIDKQMVFTSQHEYASARVKDQENNNEHLFFIERNASSTVALPTNGKTATKTVQHALSSISSAALRSPPTPSSAESIPLLPMNETPSESAKSSSLTPTLSFGQPQPTLLQRASLASTQCARLVHESFADLYDAEDRVLGTVFCDSTKGSYGSARVVREVILTDNSTFTLWHLAILVDVIHLIAPIYSLFENHCYWFVKIMCDAIVVIVDGNCTDNDQESDINNQPYRSPPNRPFPPSTYLPSLSGTWNGILVSEVKDELLATVLSNFSKRCDEEKAEVERRQDVLNERGHRELEVEELRRKAEEHEEEVKSLRSGISSVQSELMSLQHKFHALGGNVDPASNSTSLPSSGSRIR